MSRTSSSKGTLKDIEKEVRELLRDLRREDHATVKKFYLLDFEVRTFQTRLADAQYIIARKYGCKSWQDLRERHDSKDSTESSQIFSPS